MSNQVKSFNGVAIGNIKNINGLTDANIKNINGQTFTGSIPPDAFTITNYTFNGSRSWGPQMAWEPETNTLVVV